MSYPDKLIEFFANDNPQIIDNAISDIVYYGYVERQNSVATSAAIWKIKKLTTVAGVTTIQWADGNQSFDNIWDNRASLMYSFLK